MAPGGGGMSRMGGAVLMVLLLGLSGLLSRESAADERANASAGGSERPWDFAEFLARRVVVVEGEVTKAARAQRKPLETCGVHGLGPYAGWDVQLRVKSAWLGAIADTTIDTFVLGFMQYWPDSVKPGSHVVAWLGRDCDDGWRYWGQLVLVSREGGIVPEAGSGRFKEIRARTCAELKYAATHTRFPHSTALFEGADAVALARSLGPDKRPERGDATMTLTCDSLGWAIGRGRVVPRKLTIPLVEDCYAEIFTGDSLLIPVPGGFSGDTLVLGTCWSALRVKAGYVPWLGVATSDLGSVLERRRDGLHVRPLRATQ